MKSNTEIAYNLQVLHGLFHPDHNVIDLSFPGMVASNFPFGGEWGNNSVGLGTGSVNLVTRVRILSLP